jgi:hypothetical protein
VVGLSLGVDPVCINQRDDTEKTQQVMQMDLIYTRAVKVRVWLGPPSEDSDLAIDKLEALGERSNLGRNFGRLRRVPEYS